jgi:hypothetical protein
MASPLFDAVIGNLAENLNPQSRMVNEYVGKSMLQLDFELNETRMRQIEKLEEKIAAAQSRDAKPSIIEAYERMLENISKV